MNVLRKKIFNSSGEQISMSSAPITEHESIRQEEDKNCVPVILKRTDEAKVHPEDILQRAIEEGVEQHERSRLSLLLSSIAAGLIIGFSAMSVAVVFQAIGPDIDPLIQRIAIAFVYPLGFIMCIMSGTQLFTEHTATAVYPVLDRRESFKSLLHLWGIIIVGNLLGTMLSSLLIASANDVIHAASGYAEVAHHLLSYDFPSLFASSVLAGCLMAQSGWMVLATPPQSSQIVCIYIVTFVIGIGGLHHSIAGSAEIFTAVLLGSTYTWLDALYFVSTALLGNLVGGSTLVAVLNYTHVRKTKKVTLGKVI